MSASLQHQTTLWVFVPIDPHMCEPLEKESAFLELFASCLSSVVLGGMGLEWLAHAMEISEHLGSLHDVLKPQVTSQATTRAILAWQRNPTPFAPGETPGVMVPVQVATAKLTYELQRLGVMPPTGGMISRPVASSAAVPWRVVDRSRPANRPRPRW
jgi:hypothetical protein